MADQHPNEVRGPIEEKFNGQREEIITKYIADRQALEQQYRTDLADNERAKREAFLEVGRGSGGERASTRAQPQAEEAPAEETPTEEASVEEAPAEA